MNFHDFIPHFEPSSSVLVSVVRRRVNGRPDRGDPRDLKDPKGQIRLCPAQPFAIHIAGRRLIKGDIFREFTCVLSH